MEGLCYVEVVVSIKVWEDEVWLLVVDFEIDEYFKWFWVIFIEEYVEGFLLLFVINGISFV